MFELSMASLNHLGRLKKPSMNWQVEESLPGDILAYRTLLRMMDARQVQTMESWEFGAIVLSEAIEDWLSTVGPRT